MSFSTEQKQKALEIANRKISRLRRGATGYKYCISDCVTLFYTYDAELRGGSSPLQQLVPIYKDQPDFFRKLIRKGFNSPQAAVLSNGYSLVTDELQLGDVALFTYPMLKHQLSIAIFDGENWKSSSDSPKHLTLSVELVAKTTIAIMRPHNEII